MKSWKTTVAGILTAIVYMYGANVSGGMKARDALVATGIAVLGILAKDFNVSGGTQ